MRDVLRLEESAGLTGAANPDFVIERARPGDGLQIARLMADMQAPDILPLTIWSSPHADIYVEDVIQQINATNDEFRVLRLAGQILGVVYLRLVENMILIDSIYAAPEIRHDQLAPLLCHCSVVAYSRCHPSGSVALDALESARSIRALHRSLGARPHSRRLWWVLPLPKPSDSQPAEILGLAEADQTHARRGFSSFQVVTRSGSYDIGRLPGPYFRLTCAAGAEDPELLNALTCRDPVRQLLVIAEEHWTSSSFSPVAATIRSVASYDVFLQALQRLIPSRWQSQMPVFAAT